MHESSVGEKKWNGIATLGPNLYGHNPLWSTSHSTKLEEGLEKHVISDKHRNTEFARQRTGLEP